MFLQMFSLNSDFFLKRVNHNLTIFILLKICNTLKLYLQNEKIFSGYYLDMNLQLNKLNNWLKVPRPRFLRTITLKVADFGIFFIYAT